LTDGTDGVRSTNINGETSYDEFIRLLEQNERGKIISMYKNNIYFNATDLNGSSSYMNIAYQSISKNKNGESINLPGNKRLELETFVFDADKHVNVVGNTSIIGQSLDLVNSQGHKGTTSIRVRNWNPHDINSPANDLRKNFLEMKMKNNVDFSKLYGEINSDHRINISINEQPYITVAENQDFDVYIPGARRFGVDRLSLGGVKQVYADDKGNLTANSSDIRMKKNIVSINDNYGLDKVNLMNPVHFDWNDNFINPKSLKKENVQLTKGKQREIGLIAQELKSVAPECVGQDGDGLLHIDYGKIVPILIKSIQELAHDNKVMKENIEYLLNYRN
jgi:hypothetical protein